MLLACLVAALIGSALAQDQPRPTVVVQIDTGKLKGVPAQLAWSEDGKEMYLQTAEQDADGKVKKTHGFVLTLAEPTLKPVDNAPAWATRYWTWKSYNTPPDAVVPEIRVSQEMRTRVATEAAMGSGLSTGGGGVDATGSGTSVGAVATRAQQQAKVPAVILLLGTEVVGEFIGVPPVPGLTFGWAPSGPARLAYANTDGHLAIIDAQGAKRAIAGTKNVTLPAWSPDGSKIAFLSLTGKNKYDLSVVDVPR